MTKRPQSIISDVRRSRRGENNEVVLCSDKVCVCVCACVSLCAFDLWSRGHVSSVWIQLGCQEADKVSVVSCATGCDQLWASRAGRELCLCLFPATDGSVCSNHAFHNLLCLAQVVPAVVGKPSCTSYVCRTLICPFATRGGSDMRTHLCRKATAVGLLPI